MNIVRKRIRSTFWLDFHIIRVNKVLLRQCIGSSCKKWYHKFSYHMESKQNFFFCDRMSKICNGYPCPLIQFCKVLCLPDDVRICYVTDLSAYQLNLRHLIYSQQRLQICLHLLKGVKVILPPCSFGYSIANTRPRNTFSFCHCYWTWGSLSDSRNGFN